MTLREAAPTAILTEADVAEIADALESTGRHNRLAYALKSRLVRPTLAAGAQQVVVPHAMVSDEPHYRNVERAYATGWNACRQAVLFAAPQSVPQAKPNWSRLVKWWESGGEQWVELRNIVSDMIEAAPQPTQGDKA